MKAPEIRLCGDTAILAQWKEIINPRLNMAIHALCTALQNDALPGLIETVPGYNTLLLHYDPMQTDAYALQERLLSLCASLTMHRTGKQRTTEIPVCYGGEYGPDLQTVCEKASRNAQQVISLHSKPRYFIYMLGFTPGFAYMGGLNKRLATPRLKTPRTRIPAGSVGIAGDQTGIYPQTSPGGWQLIGRTPLCLFDPAREDPFLLHAGESVRFVPITEKEYLQLQEECHV